MRPLVCFTAAIILGCGALPGDPGSAATALVPVPAKPDEKIPPDLRTRKDGSDWPGFLGPRGDSTSPEKGIVTPWPKHGPRLVWQRTIGEGYSVPAISRGRLFLFDRVRRRARVRCFKSETAAPLWTFDYPTDYKDLFGYSGGPRCCPVVDGGRVYAFGPEGMLHCLRAADGKLVWKVNTHKEFGVIQNFFGVGSTPVVEGDLLLVHVGGSPKGSDKLAFEDLKGERSGLVAFDKYTGKVRYRVSDELAGYASPVLATIGKRRWCFLFARGGLLALEPSTGKVDFHYPWRTKDLESVNASNPVIVGQRVLITECYGVGSAVLDVRPGGYKEVWTDARKGRAKSLECHWMTPIHVDGYVYGSSGRYSRDAELRCVELATGKVRWRQRGLNRCSLLLVDNHFVCLGEEGSLRLIRVNPKKYDEVSAVELRAPGKGGKPDPEGAPLLEYPCWAAPILAHGLLYVRGKDRLVCLELIGAKK